MVEDRITYLSRPSVSRGIRGSVGLVCRGRMRGLRLFRIMFERAYARFFSSISVAYSH